MWSGHGNDVINHSWFSFLKNISPTPPCAVVGKWRWSSHHSRSCTPQMGRQQKKRKKKEITGIGIKKLILEFNYRHVNKWRRLLQNTHTHTHAKHWCLLVITRVPKLTLGSNGRPALAVPVSSALISQQGKQQPDERTIAQAIGRKNSPLVRTQTSLITWAGAAVCAAWLHIWMCYGV